MAAAEAAAQPEPGSEDGASSAGTERRGPGTWPGSPAPVHAGKRGERPPRPAPRRPHGGAAPAAAGRGERRGAAAGLSPWGGREADLYIYMYNSEYNIYYMYVILCFGGQQLENLHQLVETVQQRL